MHEDVLISVYTQVYNTRDYLPKCIESVLNQTHKNFEYIIVDNGSTDGCKEIIEQYAQKDDRIRVIRYENNILRGIWVNIAKESANGKYITNVDSDDWVELDFLERLIDLAEANGLDMVCTGSLFHEEGENFVITQVPRISTQQVIMDRKKVIELMRHYFQFFVTTWGKLIKREAFQKADFSVIDNNKLLYGTDTMVIFACLYKMKKICIDDSVLHHYLVRKKSSSTIYDPNRCKFSICLYHVMIDFLSNKRQISPENLNFSIAMLSIHLGTDLYNIYSSDLSAKEKLDKFSELANLPFMKKIFNLNHPSVLNLKNALSSYHDRIRRENPILFSI